MSIDSNEEPEEPTPFERGSYPDTNFRETHRTWMLDRLRAGEHAEVLRHVMAVYAQPLQACVAGMRYSWLGEPADIVHGFFAERVSRKGFMDRWNEDGRLLRDWLRIGLNYWIREVSRKEIKARGVHQVSPFLEGEELEPSDTLRRAFAMNITRLSMEETADSCRREGLDLNWRAFYLHYYDGLSYNAVGQELGLEGIQAEVKARAPRLRFRRVLRGHLERDGVAPENLGRELEALINDLEP